MAVITKIIAPEEDGAAVRHILRAKLHFSSHAVSRLAHGGDILARLEGETFLAFMECHEDARSEVQRIFTAMEGNYEDITLSVRVGAAYAQAGDKPSYEAMLSTAVQALESTNGMEDGRMVCFRWNDEAEGED